MPTFQALVYAVVYGLSEIMPVSSDAHVWSVGYFLQDWHQPSEIFLGGLSAASFFAAVVYFRHDWITAFASFLQVVLYFKKPMTLDERVVFFVLLSIFPTLAAWYYYQQHFAGMEILEPQWVAGSLVAFCIPLWISDSLNRRAKSILDWNWLDSLIVGLTQILELIPGAGRQVGAVSGTFLRNYNREAALKITFLTFAPILGAKAWMGLKGLDFSQPRADADLSWLTFSVGFLVCFFASILAIGSFMKNITHRKMAGFMMWRAVLAAGIMLAFWLRR